MAKSYEKVRFFLFTNSCSGKKISAHLKNKLKGKKLTGAIKRLSVVIDYRYSQVDNFIVLDLKPISPHKRLPSSLRIYLEIESELVKLSEEKLDEYSTASEDYHNQLLFPAIERTAGNSLTNVSSDHEFQEQLQDRIREYTNVYYKVVYKYKLPTIRIVPFILRVIS